jgi:aspartokinase-like uncharacterized kinase
MHVEVPITIVKVGGSLYDLPDLGPRLHRWLDDKDLSHVVLVPGGGSLVEAIRTLDRCHQLGEGTCHLLALQAMRLAALFLVQIVPGGAVLKDLSACTAMWKEGKLPVLDAWAFALTDEGNPGCLPHTWDVTSDSIAARLAVVMGAARLILLKSTALPAGISWQEAAQRGFVDRYFATALQDRAIDMQVINFRDI